MTEIERGFLSGLIQGFRKAAERARAAAQAHTCAFTAHEVTIVALTPQGVIDQGNADLYEAIVKDLERLAL